LPVVDAAGRPIGLVDVTDVVGMEAESPSAESPPAESPSAKSPPLAA
jgi:hypothetical protein